MPPQRSTVNPSLLVSHRFFLPTAIIIIIGWFTAFISQCIAQRNVVFVTGGASIVGVGWAVIWSQLFWIAFVLAVIVSDDVRHSRLAISTFGAVNIALSVVVIDRLIYLDEPSTKAVSAGYLIMVIINILWTIYFSSDEYSLVRDMFDKLASPAGLGTRSAPIDGQPGTAAMANVYNGNNNGNYPTSAAYQPSYPNQHASSIINDYTKDQSRSANPINQSGVDSQYAGDLSGGISSTTPMGNPASVMDVSSPSLDKVVGKATALYSYKSNQTAEPHEISFEKGEILDVLDMTSRWWVAKRQDGEVGTIPSNYVEMIK